MKEKATHTNSGQVPQKASCRNNVAPAYHCHIAHPSQILYPSSTLTLKIDIRKPDRLKETECSLQLAELRTKLMSKLVKTNLVT